jgi:hypothetical protein
MKIIYLSYAPLTSTLADAYYIPQLIKKNIIIEYCDCSNFFKLPPPKHDSRFKSQITNITSKQDFNNVFINSDCSSTLVIIGPGLEYRFKYLYMLPVIYNKFKFATFHMGKNPRPRHLRLKNFFKNIKQPNILISKVFQNIALKLLIKMKKVTYPKNIFMVGKGISDSSNRSIKFFPINYVDYDLAISKSKKDTPLLKMEYMLFIDQAHCSHPDLKIVYKNEGEITSFNDIYLEQLCEIFQEAEKKMGLPVVIAAHPKSNYKDGDFNDRLIIKNKTAQLISGASVIFAHFSTASLQASYYKIPIHFLIPNVFTQLPDYPIDHAREVEAFAKEFGAHTIKTPEDINNIDLTAISLENHEYILNTYLRSYETKDIQSSQVFTGYLKEILDKGN